MLFNWRTVALCHSLEKKYSYTFVLRVKSDPNQEGISHARSLSATVNVNLETSISAASSWAETGSSSDVWSRPLSFRIVEPHSFHRATALSHNSYRYNNRPVAMNGIYILPCQIILLDEHWVRAIPTYLKLPLCNLRHGILKTQNVSNPWYCITPPLNHSNSKTDNQVLKFRRTVR